MTEMEETKLNPKEAQLLDYLYEELSPQEKMVFKQELETDSDLARELKSYLQLRGLFHEHLPQQKVPSGLVRQVMRELQIRKPWYTVFTEGFWRPALVGAFALVMAIGITSRFTGWRQEKPTLKESASVATQGPELNLQASPWNNSLAKAPAFSPQLNQFSPQSRSSLGAGAQLVSFGPSVSMDMPTAGLPEAQLHDMEMKAQHEVAQFVHQQALRLRAMGDYHGAADQLAYLIKTYPFYPYKLHAMAQRVDLLFRDGEVDLAKQELKVLREISPKLAFLVERRWQ